MKLKKIILSLSGLLDPPFSKGVHVNGRYLVISHLGTGSYGHSYLVVDQETNSKVVLKTLRLHRRLFQSGKTDFEHEKEFLQSILHSGFPKYLQSGTNNGIPFYTMEYIEGKNFEQLIFDEGKQFKELEAFQIVYQLISLIQVLHSKKIIHRDIRIPNVITDGSNLWLIDLGLAIKQSSIPSEKKISSFRKQASVQADFYSLGHFLLFLLYSNFAFSRGSKARSWEEELNLSEKSKHIIQRLLAIKTPYQNCNQIQKDIENIILNGEKENVIF